MKRIGSIDSTCGSKDAHPTARAARKSITNKRVKGHPKGFKIDVYKCPYCNKYHVGKSKQKPKNIPDVI